jgi:glycosyltransferase involved in cell wall biosynthesis
VGKVVLWVSSIGGTGGQAIVTRQVISLLRQNFADVHVIEYNRYEQNYFGIQFLFACFKLISFRFNHDFIYFCPSRNPKAFVKDLIVYFFPASKVIAHIHGGDLDNLFSLRFFGPILKSRFSKFKSVIFPSKVAVPLSYANYTNVCCIDNYSVLHELINFKSSLFLPSDRNFIWNSNIIATKGVFDFISTLDNVLFSPYSTLFFGKILSCNSYSYNDTEYRFKDYIANNNAIYFGEVSRIEISSNLKFTDIVVLTSYSECQPLALIDAVCCGAIIVASDIPAHRDLLKDYSRVFFVSSNPSSIRDGLLNALKLQENNSLTDSYNAEIDRYRSRFSVAVFNKNILKLFL